MIYNAFCITNPIEYLSIELQKDLEVIQKSHAINNY